MNVWSERRIHALLFVLWTALALIVLWQYDLLGRKLDADASFMLYAGQQILRGYAPYVGVAIVKLPVSPLVAALGIAVGRAFGIEDLIGGRLAFWLCAGLTVGATFLVGVQLPRPSRFPDVIIGKTSKVWGIVLGSLAAIVLLTSQALGVQVTEGPEAKLPMICAGMFCLVLIARRQFFWAGIAGSISFMAWQPGLIFVAATVVCAFVVQDKKRALISSLAGIALPILVIGIYLALNGALVSMFHQAFGANADYFGEKKAASLFEIVIGNVSNLWAVSHDCSSNQVPLVMLGYIGMGGGALYLIYRFWKTCDSQLFLAGFPLLISGAALFGFSLIDLQKCSDVTPLLPYFALGAAACFLVLPVLVSRFLARLAPQFETRAALGIGILFFALLLWYGTRAAVGQSNQNGLAQQRALAELLATKLQPNDRVQQFGDTVFLVLTQRENATRFVHLGDKQGYGILTAEGMSAEQLTAQLHAANPRMITLSRAKNKEWAQPLYDWLQATYHLDSSYGASDGGTLRETDVYWLK